MHIWLLALYCLEVVSLVTETNFSAYDRSVLSESENLYQGNILHDNPLKAVSPISGSNMLLLSNSPIEFHNS